VYSTIALILTHPSVFNHVKELIRNNDTDIDAINCGLGQVGMEVGRAGSSAANLSLAALSIPQEIV
jgi:hypothetical protein